MSCYKNGYGLAVVQWPSSLSQFVKLGKRLAQPGDASPADLALLEEWLLAYDAPLTYVTQRLKEHGFHPVHRIKTTPVLIEKLRRSPGLAITHIRDIAGARVLVTGLTIPAGASIPIAGGGPTTLVRDVTLATGGLASQAAFVGLICKIFDHERCVKQAKMIDHIAAPNHGYRAKHVVVYPDGLPVEIQIRTPLQHLWAELNEKLGDRWGRGLRYGNEPDDPDCLIAGEVSLTRRDFVAALQRLSELIAESEQVDSTLQRIDLQLHCIDQNLIEGDVASALETARSKHHAEKAQLSAMLEALLGIVDRLEAP